MSFILAYGAERVSQRWRNHRPREGEASSANRTDTAESLEDLCQGLRENRLRTLSIGWNESDFIRSDKSVGVLEKAWQRNRSVTSVSIGLRIAQSSHYKAVEGDGRPGIPVHTRNRRLLCLTLDRVLAQKSPHYILSLRLVLDDWIPEHLLHAILKQQVHLQSIEFHGVTCRTVARRNQNTDSLRSETSTSTTASTAQSDSTASSVRSEYAAAAVVKRLLSKKKQHGVANIDMLSNDKTHNHSNDRHPRVPRVNRNRSVPVDLVSVVLPHLVRLHSPLKSLKLIDCGLTDEDLDMLVQALANHKNLEELSLRSNRRLTGTGAATLCASFRGTSLDLSLCDLTRFDAPDITAALSRRTVPLSKLLLCGNYQLDTIGLVQLVQASVLQKVVALDLSYCEWGESRTTRTLQQIVASHAEGPTALREIVLQGCTLTSHASRQALLNLLTAPHVRLRRLVLNDPVESGKYWSTEALEQVADIMPSNYDVEELVLDYMYTQPNAQVWKRIQPWLEWNKLGRRVVVPGRTVSAAEWLESIYKASQKDDLDVLYWFIRQSTGRF